MPQTQTSSVAEAGAIESWIEPRPWLVLDVRREAPDVVTLGLAPPDPFEFLPGQFNVLLPPGIGEVPVSISSDPATSDFVRHTIRDADPVTRALCTVRPGQQVGVRGPYGTSWPVATAAGGDLVIVAAGIGLPPLRPALYQALGQRDRFGAIVLLYGARTPADLLFARELDSWRDQFGIELHVTVDAADRHWGGNVGVVPGLIPRARFDPAAATAFVAGPAAMMRFTVQALLAAGLADDRIYLSQERRVQCAAALCGRTPGQAGPRSTS